MRRWRFPEPGPSQLVSERGTSQGEEPLVGHDYEDDDEQRGEKLASIERSTESVRDRLMLNAEIWSIRSKLDLELAEIRSKFDREQAAIKSRFDLEKVGIKSEFAMYYTQFQLFLSRTGASADAHQVSDAGTQRTRSTIEKNKVRFQQATTVLTIPSMSSAAKFAKSMEAHSISSRPIPSSSLSTIVQEQASMAVKVILQSQADRVQLAGRSPNSKGIVKKKKKMKNWSIWQEIDDCEMYPIFDPGGVVGRRNLEEKIGGGMNSLLCEKVENSTGPSFDPRMFKWPLPGSKNGDNGEPEGFILSYKLESEELTADIGDRETFFAGNQLVVNAENSAWKRANEISEGIPEVTVDRGMGAEKLEVVLFETMGEEVIGGQEINMVTEAQAAAAEEKERIMNERLSQSLSRITVLETQISCLRMEHTQLSRSLEKERQRAAESRQEYLAAMEEAATQEGHAKQLDDAIKELRNRHKRMMQEEITKLDLLAKELESERAARVELEKAASYQISRVSGHEHITKHSNPTLENGNMPMLKLSTAGSMEESHFLQASLDTSDGVFLERRASGETTVSPYFLKSMTTSAFEAALRQKGGELASYVSRLVSLESIRDSLSEELVKITEQCEKLRAEAAVLPGIRAELDALRRRHSSALELMGERDEALEELRNDIADLKEMYREQVDLLVNKIQVLSSSAGAA